MGHSSTAIPFMTYLGQDKDSRKLPYSIGLSLQVETDGPRVKGNYNVLFRLTEKKHSTPIYKAEKLPLVKWVISHIVTIVTKALLPPFIELEKNESKMGICVEDREVKIGQEAPDFCCSAVDDEEFVEIKLK